MTKTEVEVQKPGDALFNKSFDIIKKSMEDVKQEIVITLLDGSAHIVYIHSVKILGNSVEVNFSTLSDDRKDELAPHVDECIKMQIYNHLKEYNKRKKFSF